MTKPKTQAKEADAAAKAAAPKPSTKISKKYRAINSLSVRRDMHSFYEGGPFQPVSGDKALGLFSGQVTVISLATKEVLMRIRHEEESISHFAFLRKGTENTVFTATSNGLLRRLRVVGDWKSVEVETMKKLPKFATCEMRVDGSGKFLVVSNAAGEVRVLGAKGLEVLRECRLGTGHLRLRLIGSYIGFASRSRTVVLYNILSNKKVRIFKTDAEDSFADFCVVDSAKKHLLIAGLDGRLWLTLDDGSLQLIDKREAGITALESVRSGKGVLVFIGLETGQVDVGQIEDQSSLRPRFAHLTTTLTENRYTIAGFAVDVTEGRVFTMTEEGTVFVLRLKSAKNSSQIRIEQVETMVGLNDHTTEVRFLCKDQFFVCSNSEAVRWHNLAENSTTLLRGHEDLCTAVDVFGDRRLVTGGRDGRVLLWDVSVPEAEEPADGEALQAIKPSITIRKKYKAHTGHIACLSLGKRSGEVFLSAGSEGQIKFWDLRANTCKTLVVDVKDINSAVLSHCERLVAVTGHDKRVFLYSTPELEQVAVIAAHERSVWDAAFSSDSHKLASASSDHRVKVWDISDRSRPREELALEGHSASVLKVKWFFNDLQLVSGAADGVIKLWNARKGTCLYSCERLTGRVWALDVWERSPDLQAPEQSLIRILAGDNENNLVLFEDSTAKTDKELLAAEQEQDKAVDEVKMALANRDFADGLRTSFRTGLPRQFFHVLQAWHNHVLFATPLVFNYDETVTKVLFEARTQEAAAAFANLLDGLTSELIEEDFPRLLLLVKNHVTNNKTAFFAQLLLRSVLNNLSLSRNTDYRRTLGEHGSDWRQLLEILSVFADRSQLLADQSLKLALQLDFELEAINPL